jgi:hypothetical protein
VLLPLLTVFFALSKTMLTAILAMVAVGIVLLVLQSLTITIVQVHIADRVRGRVMSLYSQLHAGADTGGNMVIGVLALQLGLPQSLALGGAVALVYALALWLILPAVRRLD